MFFMLDSEIHADPKKQFVLSTTLIKWGAYLCQKVSFVIVKAWDIILAPSRTTEQIFMRFNIERFY
jgi:hypothetical protein